MLSVVVSLLLWAAPATPEQPVERNDVPTDPLFDKQLVATDDPAFILAAVESTRQNETDAKLAGRKFSEKRLRAAAASIEKQNALTSRKLVSLAQHKGWQLPAQNSDREITIAEGSAPRTAANFIRNQIAFHQTTVAQYRAQLAGTHDADLKRTLNAALPGYESNLKLLLDISPQGAR